MGACLILSERVMPANALPMISTFATGPFPPSIRNPAPALSKNSEFSMRTLAIFAPLDRAQGQCQSWDAFRAYS